MISVNVSAYEFRQPELALDLWQVLRETGIAPSRLYLEIAESIVMENAEATIAMLWHLKSLGVSLAIDGFGTGYSALSYLKHFPVDRIKIDRSFIAEVGRDLEGTAIVQALLALAQTLKLEVIAEGVETAEQAAHLRELGGLIGQGYHLGHPLPAEEAEALLGRAERDSERGPLACALCP
jgi:EAL domain-containing protein (putative c-di-GMP-specific phosphodiesterase class I)